VLQNKRPDYIESFVEKLINWNKVTDVLLRHVEHPASDKQGKDWEWPVAMVVSD